MANGGSTPALVGEEPSPALDRDLGNHPILQTALFFAVASFAFFLLGSEAGDGEVDDTRLLDADLEDGFCLARDVETAAREWRA